MIKSHFKIAFRYILRNKGYSTLNILGLAIGMSVAMTIGLWVYHQYTYDRFLPGYENVYQVKRNFNSNGETLTFNTTSLKLADALRKQIPEIEHVAEADWMGPHGLVYGNKKFYTKGGIVGGDFLKMFAFPLEQGNASNVLNDPYSIVLTNAMAKALFGTQNPMGKTIRFDNAHSLKVTGVLKNIPANSTFQFSYLVPFSFLDQTNNDVKAARSGNFSWNSFQQFVQLKPGISYAQVAPKLKDIEKTEKDNQNAMLSDVILQPLKDWHLYNEYKNGVAVGGFITYVHMFSLIGLSVLLIACINFVNLSTARSEKRAREVGVRKTIGSARSSLIVQFLSESFILAACSLFLAFIFVLLALPQFNILAETQIQVPYSNPILWLILVGFLFLTTILAGSRPAFYLSSFNPIDVLNNRLREGKAAALPRKILVVVQFSCSIALIISTIVIYQQIQHAKDRPTGYDNNRLLMTDNNADLERNFAPLKNDLQDRGIITNMTSASSPVDDVYGHADIESWPGKNAGETIEMGIIMVTDNYFKTVGMTMNTGRDFKPGGDTTSVILNEMAVKKMRLKNPVDLVITAFGKRLRIVGVVKDALMLSPFAPADPTMFYYTPVPQGNIIYRIASNKNTSEAITNLNKVFSAYSPAYPYTYNFVDASYANKFQIEVLIGKLAGIFACLAIFISCLGLFGLAAYMAEQRTKEIGVRKVLGATVSQLWLLLSRDFMKLVFISCLIASPLAFIILQNWLEKYSYRITMGPLVFILAACMALVITLVTISFQAVKAALANPVKSLRNE